MLHVSVGAARKCLDVIDREDCRGMNFYSWQYPECLALIGPDGDKEETGAMYGSKLEECETCEAEIYPQPLSGSTSTGSAPDASDERPLATQARAPFPGASTFKIMIDRSDGSELGISIGYFADGAVIITSLKKGLVEQ